jgi:protein-tyrosine phosphatase
MIGDRNPNTDTLPQLTPGQSLGLALGIAPVPNLRDLGGYSTRGGATVRSGLVYRSDCFNPMGKEDIHALARLTLKNVYDLRTVAEIRVQPDELPDGVGYTHLDVLADADSAAPAQLGALIHEPEKANVVLGDGKIDALFVESYREFVFLPSANDSYRTLFLALADKANAPGVFHCTTGKDRTGWAAASLLTLLGVPEETVMAAFLQSSEYTLPHFQKAIDGFVAAGGDRAIPTAIFGVKQAYLEASFDEMQKRYGTIEGYFAEALGIDAPGQQALRDLYLEKM